MCTDSQSNLNTKPGGGVVCTDSQGRRNVYRLTGEGQWHTDRLTEQHEHQTQGRGIVYTQRGGVVCTDSFTEQHEHQIQGRSSVHRLTGEG